MGKINLIKYYTLVFLILFFGQNSVQAREPDWFLKLQKIKVFKTHREEVEKIFNSPKILYSSNRDGKEPGWGEIVEYQSNDGIIEVFYSTGKCSQLTNPDGWDVDEGIVVSIEFKPNVPVELPELNLNLSTFIAEKADDTQYYSYRSEKLGIEFTTLGGKVTSVEYSLTPEMKKLDCKTILKKKK